MNRRIRHLVQGAASVMGFGRPGYDRAQVARRIRHAQALALQTGGSPDEVLRSEFAWRLAGQLSLAGLCVGFMGATLWAVEHDWPMALQVLLAASPGALCVGAMLWAKRLGSAA